MTARLLLLVILSVPAMGQTPPMLPGSLPASRPDGRLDLPRDSRPVAHPSRVLSRSTLIPGLGWASMNDYRYGSRSDLVIGAAFLASTIAAFVLAANGIRNDSRGQASFAMGGFFILRYFDITTSTDEAVRRSGT